jgi:ABC-type uncharacterized transport system ATPase subunit
VLEVQDMTVMDERGQVAVDGVSFDVRAGEILGVAGVQGNGQTELVGALTGLREIAGGQFILLGHRFGKKVDFRNGLEKFVLSKAYKRAFNIALGVLVTVIILDFLFQFYRSLPGVSARFHDVPEHCGWVGRADTAAASCILGVPAVHRPQEVAQPQPTNVRKLTELGSGHIPEDRQQDGLVLGYSIADNLVLNTYYREPYARRGVIQEKPIQERAYDLVEKFDIRTPDALNTAGSLSGGNQQKVIVAREFSRATKFMMAAQPTRGLDVGSIEYIHNRLIEKRDEGTAVLLVSTELDEVMQLSDRIAVMYDGKIVDILQADRVTKEIVGLLMAGEKPHDAWKSSNGKKKQV